MNQRIPDRRKLERAVTLAALTLALAFASTRLEAQTGCPTNPTPFTDLGQMPTVFCQAVASVYFSGITAGATATTYEPLTTVNRGQMAAFLSRTHDSALRRSSRRAALGQWWTISRPFPNGDFFAFPGSVNLVQSDGADVYVGVSLVPGVPGSQHQLLRFRASGHHRGELQALYTDIENVYGLVVTPHYVYVTGRTNPGRLYRIRRGQATGSGTLLTSGLGAGPTGVAYDGERVWTANAEGNSVSVYNPTTDGLDNLPGFQNPFGILYDGAHIWVANYGNQSGNTLVKLDQNGGVLQTVTVGQGPSFLMFDGINIWVPNYNANTLSVVRVKDGAGNPLPTAFVLTTLTGNGLQQPNAIAFDGQRVLVTNVAGGSLSLWKATDLTPLGSVSPAGPAGMVPFGACSDGQDFWVSLRGTPSGTLLKF